MSVKQALGFMGSCYACRICVQTTAEGMWTAECTAMESIWHKRHRLCLYYVFLCIQQATVLSFSLFSLVFQIYFSLCISLFLSLSLYSFNDIIFVHFSSDICSVSGGSSIVAMATIHQVTWCANRFRSRKLKWNLQCSALPSSRPGINFLILSDWFLTMV